MPQSRTNPIQAPKNTEGLQKSDTENARTVAAKLGWSFNEADQVVDASGRVVGYTIKDVASAMVDAGWIMPDLARTNWNAVPEDEVAASSQLRGHLGKDGRHRGRWSL